MCDARRRHKVQHALDQRQPGAEDRRENELLAGDLGRLHARHRRLDLGPFKRQIARDLVAEQDAELAAQLAEGFGRKLLLPDQRQLVLHQRMIDDCHALHGLSRFKTPCRR